MTISSVLSSLPSNIAMYVLSALLVFGGLVWYALRTKGDVRAVLSYGKTVIELEAKERKLASTPNAPRLP